MKVLLPAALTSYTRASRVEADGGTLTELFADLDRRYPGLRFRVDFDPPILGVGLDIEAATMLVGEF